LEAKERALPEHLQRFGFHDCRHHFISYAVMSGIDFMTIARWVGHKDGGISHRQGVWALEQRTRASTGGPAELWPNRCANAAGSDRMTVSWKENLARI